METILSRTSSATDRLADFFIFTVVAGSASIYSAFCQGSSHLISFNIGDAGRKAGVGIDNVTNVPNVIENEERTKGVYLEGRRDNILEINCIEKIVEKNRSIATLSQSEIAPDFKQATFLLEPNSIVNMEFDGYPVLHRQDYTFSFIVLADNPTAKMEIFYTLQSDNSEVSAKYDYKQASPYQVITSKNVKTYRPQISYYFPEVPRFLKGRVRVTNTSNKSFKISVVLPVIEEGLFATSPIACGSKRGGETLAYSSLGNMPHDLNEGGTISFIFSPSWNASRLTPGIDPHLVNWTDSNGVNGIKIISDSSNHGKLKA